MGRRRSSRSEEGAEPSAQAQGQPQLPWGMGKTEMQPSSLTSLTDDKLARFVLGHQKKTKFQKEREDRETKKRQADEEAAKIYATFVASFDNEDETKGKAFVRGGTHQASRQSGDVYRLKAKESTGAASAGKKVTEMDKMLQEIKQKDTELASRRQQAQSVQKPKKRRAIDEFLEEMKERGPAPVSMEGVSMTKGSFDTGDPETTNLYVGNLAPTVTEEALEAEFGRYGDVYSVKIMWPRSEEERARRRNCGFVSFYERRDADEARINLNNKEVEGQPMIVGWGKAVKIQPRARAPGLLLPSAVTPPPVAAIPAVPIANAANLAVQRTIKVEVPCDGEVKRRVDHLAHYVAADGLQFENAVRMREANSKAKYGFLLEPQSAVALYYRWRVYSFAMGDDEHLWRENSFQMTVDGPVWMPPKMPARPHGSRSGKSASRSSGRLGHRSRSPASSRGHRSGSRSYSGSRSRSSSASPRRRRRRSRSGSRHRSRSRSRSSDDGRHKKRSRRHSRRSHSRSRSRGRRSRSCSSDDSNSRRRSRRSRSRSRSRRDDHQHGNSHQGRSRRIDDRSRDGLSLANKDEKLLTGQQIARAREMERGRERNRLASEDYDDFKALLDELTLERESVKRTMGFALDNSEAAVDLVNVILDSFKSSTASGVALVGLLYVTSDILHNSSAAVKNASLFRTTFQECLPEIMDTLRLAHKNIAGRMSANAMKEKVMNVLTAWESWSLFPPAVLVGLHATFLRKVEGEEFIASRSLSVDGIGETDLERLRKTCRQSGVLATGDAKHLAARLQWLQEFTSPTAPSASGQARVPSALPSSIVDQPKTNTSQEATGEIKEVGKPDWDNLDGEPIDDDLDGDSIDGEPLAEGSNDLDGEPMDEGEALDGEPLDGEDLDGAPMDDDVDGEPI